MNFFNLSKILRLSLLTLMGGGFLAAPCLHAEDVLSVPEVATPANASDQGVSLPAPSESEKAPTAVKPSAKPQFTLPEVVITGDNQLTIGAKRLERHEDDVTRGSQELRGLSRSENDLPGLENQRTGLSALSPEAARDTVAILHGGVGTQSTWEGWGLLGMQLKGFRALLDAMGDQYGGVSLGDGKNRRKMAGWGGVLQAEPFEALQLRFSRDYRGHRNDLPYQSEIENRRASATEGDAVYRFAPNWKVDVRAFYWDTVLEPGRPFKADGFHTIEREGRARLEWDTQGAFLENCWGEAGGRSSGGNFDTSSLNRFDAAWGRAGLRLALLSKVSLDLSMGAVRLGGVDLPVKGEPKVELEILPDEATLLRLHGRSARELQLFQETQGSAAYTLPLSGFSTPGFIRKEGGVDVERRITEGLSASAGGRVWDEESHPQWTETDTILHRPIWESVGLLRCWEGRIGLKADLEHDLALQLDGRLSQAQNRSLDGKCATGWPRHQGTATLYRKTSKDYVGLTAKAAASREADSLGGVTLAPYWTLSLEARRALNDLLTVWADGENLTGQRYELVPGYPEPRFLVRAGIELIF